MSKSQLIEAARSGRPAAVEELLKSGADVNEQDEQGWTAVKFAAGRGDLAAVEALARAGADLNPVGRDQRSPYDVALAAGQVGVAKFLRAAGASAASSARQPGKVYCRAYRLSELRRFPGWRQENAQAMRDDTVVYLHQDYSVTKSMWPGEGVIFAAADRPWVEFCEAALNFSPVDDLELARAAGAR